MRDARTWCRWWRRRASSAATSIAACCARWCDLSEDEVDDVIDELEDALVLEPWGTDGWRFRHELLREVAAELAPPSVRRGLHAKVADALVHGVGGGDPDWRRVADHYEQAERFDEAAWAYQQASAAAARRRGALAEARTYLTLALAGLDRTTPGPDRDRREIAVRLERGFLAAALEGNQTRAAVRDFERCLQLGGTDLGDKELVATMVALMVYYFTRADLDRVVEVLEALRAGLKQGRPWLRPVIDASFGVVAWHRGEFDAARSRLEEAMAGLAAAGQRRRGVVSAQRPDRDGAPAPGLGALRARRSHRRRGRAGAGGTPGRRARFPPGSVQRGFRVFRGDLAAHRSRSARPGRGAGRRPDRAGRAARLRRLAAVGRCPAGHRQRPGRAGRRGPRPDRAVESHRDHDHVRRRLAQGRAERLHHLLRQRARAAVDRRRATRPGPRPPGHRAALARDTGMHFYDAELLRLRAHTHTDPDARQADIGAALDLARRQGATLFELRAALDDFELRGEPARAAVVDAVSRFPVNNAWPELARAQAALDLI